MPFSRPYQKGDGYIVESAEDQFKQYGVKAIQAELFRLGVIQTASRVNGVFGFWTKRAVKKFQTIKGLGADGVVGPATLEALFRPRTAQISTEFGSLPSRLIGAIIEKESQFDPGAYYFNEASTDRGIAMLNSSAYPGIADPEAFDVEVGVREAGKRLTKAFELYSGRGYNLRRECTIASYNSPAGASDHFNGIAISEKLAGYIEDVMALLTEAKIKATT